MRRIRNGQHEHGAVAALVAIMMSSGVLLASGALVIDVGQAYAERAQLQNGADSAVLAVGSGCGRGPSYCDASTSSTSVAGKHANYNADDGTSTVSVVCGHDPAGILPATCPVPTGGALDCGAAPAAGTNYAEVHTTTRTSTGSSLLPPVFGRAVLGDSYHGFGVSACARAAWGTPAAGNGLAMTISYCEWLSYVGGNAAQPIYAAPPPAVPAAGAERVIYFHDTNPTPTHCIAGPSGFDVPGDFGSTQTTSSNCTTLFNFDPAAGTTTYNSVSGSSLSGQCQSALLNARNSHQVTFIPIYDKVTGTGGNGSYTLWSMAAFVVTGYFWPSWSANSWLTNKQPCKGSARCISGYFTTGVTSGNAIGSGTGAGATVLQLTN